MKRFLMILSAILVLLSSCRVQPDIETPQSEISSWEDIFISYWENMNTNYIFWNIDSPEGEWDMVYDEYLPLFRDLGSVFDENTLSQATEYFYQIMIDELSDFHYSFSLGNYFVSRPFVEMLHNRGYGYSEIFEMIAADTFYDKAISDTDYSENAASILSTSAGLSLPLESRRSVFMEVNAPAYFEKLYVLQLYSSADGSYTYYAFGKTNDDIAYIVLSGFNLLPDSSDPAVEQFINTWRSMIQGYLNGTGENIDGLIIDMRGNTGGYNLDINLLWSVLFPADKYIADYFAKDGMNRNDYGPSLKYIVHGNPETSRDFDKPIAVLTNNATVSNGEITVLMAKALKDYYGFRTASFGRTTCGGFGTSYENEDWYSITENEDPYIFNAGQFQVGDILFVKTPSRQGRYRNGTTYEGIGIEPDYPVENRLALGADTCIDAALEWIRGE